MRVPVIPKAPMPNLAWNIARGIIEESLADAVDTLEVGPAYGIIGTHCHRESVSVDFNIPCVVIRYKLSEKFLCRIDVPYPKDEPRSPMRMNKTILDCPRRVVRRK